MWIRVVQAVALIAALTPTAHANPAAAEKIYRDGKALLAAGKIDEACEAFRRSNELEARVGTLLNLADCEEKRSHFATAWVAWVDARGLAARLGDARGTLADQRAAALAPKLAYLTVKLSSARLPQGSVVRRNGAEVLPAELEVEVPLDPGHFDFEASAPGHITWKHSIDLTFGQHQTIEIPALAVDPNAPITTLTTTGPQPLPLPAPGTTHRIGFGVGIGMMFDGSVIYTARVPIHLIVAGPGTLRLVPSFSFSPTLDDENGDRKQHLFVFAVGFEYVHPVARQFIVAAGVVGGVELLDDSYGNGRITKHPWFAARVSPTLRLPYSIDLALQLQVGGSDRYPLDGEAGMPGTFHGQATVGVDYFFR